MLIQNTTRQVKIDGLVCQGAKVGLKDQTQVVHVSPLKVLSNQYGRNASASWDVSCQKRESAKDAEPGVSRAWVKPKLFPSPSLMRVSSQAAQAASSLVRPLSLLSGRLFANSLDDFYRVGIKCSGKFNKFNDIETTLPDFNLGYVRLGFCEAFRYIGLA